MAEALRQRRVIRRRPSIAFILTLAVPALVAIPVVIGLAGTILPAFGYLPALGRTRLSLEPFRTVLAEPGLFRSVATSFGVGLAATLLSVALTLLFVGSFTGGRAIGALRAILPPIIAVPHAAAAFGLLLLIAPSGFLVRLAAGPLGIERPPDLPIVNDPLGLSMLAALVLKELPFLLLLGFAALPQTDAVRRLKTMRTVGYGRLAGFLVAVWPSLYARIRWPVLAVLAYATSVVDVAIILGPTAPPPLAVRLLRWANDPDLSFRFKAAAASVLQIGVTGSAAIAWLGIERFGRIMLSRFSANGARFRNDRPARWIAGGTVALAAVTVLAGLILLGLWSIAALWPFPAVLPDGIHVRNWSRALGSASDPTLTALQIASLATALAAVLAVLLLEARRRTHIGPLPRLDATSAALLYLPLVAPQVSFLFGLQVTTLWVGLAPSLALLVATHLLFVLPYVVLALAGPWFELDPRYERQAATLGQGPLARLATIRVPILMGPILTALAIGSAVSIGLYVPTAIIGAGRLPTITTEAVALSSGGSPRIIGVYALLQTALPAVGFLIATLVPLALWRNRRAMRVWR